MGEGESLHIPSLQAGSPPGSEDLRIVVQGQLTADVLVELEGFGVRAAHPGLLLFGSIPDQAALGGTLRRLHAAGLVITTVECHRRSFHVASPADPQPGQPTRPHRHVARIEVDGRTNPATSTLEFHLVDDDELFVVLDALEEWGLHLRTVTTDA